MFSSVNAHGVQANQVDGKIHLVAAIDSETQFFAVFDSLDDVKKKTGKHFEDLTPLDLFHYVTRPDN